MKRLFKGLLYLVVLLAAVFVVGGFLLPASTHVERCMVTTLAAFRRPRARVASMLGTSPR